jgi:hypothetical protein
MPARSRSATRSASCGATATPPDLVINPGRGDERHVLKATRLKPWVMDVRNRHFSRQVAKEIYGVDAR